MMLASVRWRQKHSRSWECQRSEDVTDPLATTPSSSLEEETDMSGNEPAAGTQGPLPPEEPRVGGGATATVAPPTGTAWRRAFGGVREQLGLRGMISEYMTPVETNTFWYTLGGVLAISLLLEIATGM